MIIGYLDPWGGFRVLASSALNQTDESMGRGICSDDRMLEFLCQHGLRYN